MKFWAKLKLKEEKNADGLIREFFENFNSKSSIVIKGEEAKVEVVFDSEPPKELIKAITQYDIVEFNFGKVLGEYSEDEIKQVVEKEEPSEETEDSVTEEEHPEETEDSDTEEEHPKETEDLDTEEEHPKETEDSVTEEEHPEETEDSDTQGENPKQTGQVADDKGHKSAIKKPRKVVDVETVNLPQLEEIAKKAESFEHFAKLIAEYLEMDKREEIFKNFVIIASEIEKISLRTLKEALKDKNVFYTEWDKIWISKQVGEKLKDYSITLLPLLKALRQYKNYSFGGDAIEFVDESIDESITESVTETITETVDTTPKIRVKMECMPEIPLFEETLGSVDKTQPIEERVKYVLSSMGWDELDEEEQQQVFQFANVAVRIREMSIAAILLKAKIPMESSMQIRMLFASFINDFVSKYDSDMKVKVLKFLEELQKIVMNESEIESLADFTN